MGRFAIVLMLIPLPLLAQSWEKLGTQEIQTALTDQFFQYDNGATQRFYASGRTLYNAGHDSWGYWDTREGRYCSQWPPADGWACYDVEMSGEQIRFIGDSGDVTMGKRQ